MKSNLLQYYLNWNVKCYVLIILGISCLIVYVQQEDSLDAWMVIPISLFNIFEFLYFLFVSMLLSVATNRTYRDSMNFVTSTYCTGLILYIIIVVFIVLCIVE